MTLPDFYNKFGKHLHWIGAKTIYLVRHGSWAYGTNIEGSDEDFKGICIPPQEYYLGFNSKFEQAELNEPDVVIYELTKFFKLAAASNPNVVEVLFVDDADIIYMNDLGAEIRANRDKFLSKRIKNTFAGYAFSQLKRIKLHRKYLLNPPQSPPTRAEMGLPEQTVIPRDQLVAAQAEIQKEIDRMNFSFMDELSEATKIGISNAMSEMLAELKITSDEQWLSAARRVGLADNFIEIMQRERAYSSKKREFDQYQNWKENRNPKRAELERKYGFDSKHALHLVRLIRVCREVLTTGKVIVKRPDRDELLAIRNGEWSYDKLLEFVDAEENQLEKIYNSKENNILPAVPDIKFLDELCISLVERSCNI